MSDQPDLIGLKMGEFQQKNEDAEKLCKKSRGSYLIITERNSRDTANKPSHPAPTKALPESRHSVCDHSQW